MKTAHLIPGAGEDFYCENCLRDAAAVRALRRCGQDAWTVPVYLPPVMFEPDDRTTPIFFGGINVYLQQKLSLFRRTPRWLDRLFDSTRLLRWAGRRAGMTSAADLGGPALSMLRGERGRQVKELERMISWLAEHDPPEVVWLSNALLVGLVRRTRAVLDVPVVCWLQDEQAFLDSLDEPFRGRAWAELTERAREVDAFVAPSRYYAGVMQDRLSLPADRVHVVSIGLDAADYAPPTPPPDPPAVGFLSEMCRGKGLDLLVEAFLALRAGGRFPGLKLRVAGGMTRADRAFVASQRARLAEAGADDDAEFIAALDGDAKRAFLRTVSVVSVPSRSPDAYGLFALEALAAGVPVVLPDHGGFGELIEATGGGILCEPNDAGSLARALAEVLADPDRRARMGRRGRAAVAEEFSMERMGRQLLRICEQVTGRTAE